jgi:hypothetical protein
MPGQGGIDVIKQPFAHHEGFARAAFLAGTAVEAQRAGAAVLLQPVPGGDRGGERRRTSRLCPQPWPFSPGVEDAGPRSGPAG